MHHLPLQQNRTTSLPSSHQTIRQRIANYSSHVQKTPGHRKEIYVRGLGFLHPPLPLHKTQNPKQRNCTIRETRACIHKKTREKGKGDSLLRPLNQEYEHAEADSQTPNLQNPEPIHPTGPCTIYTRKKWQLKIKLCSRSRAIHTEIGGTMSVMAMGARSSSTMDRDSPVPKWQHRLVLVCHQRHPMGLLACPRRDVYPH
jgi:hypothetical protein